jgi:hypothetical protein
MHKHAVVAANHCSMVQMLTCASVEHAVHFECQVAQDPIALGEDGLPNSKTQAFSRGVVHQLCLHGCCFNASSCCCCKAQAALSGYRSAHRPTFRYLVPSTLASNGSNGSATKPDSNDSASVHFDPVVGANWLLRAYHDRLDSRSQHGRGREIHRTIQSWSVMRVPFVSEFRPSPESHIRLAALTFFATYN